MPALFFCYAERLAGLLFLEDQSMSQSMSQSISDHRVRVGAIAIGADRLPIAPAMRTPHNRVLPAQ
jgi:hypothetical protein